jgi:hypothetical protein
VVRYFSGTLQHDRAFGPLSVEPDFDRRRPARLPASVWSLSRFERKGLLRHFPSDSGELCPSRVNVPVNVAPLAVRSRTRVAPALVTPSHFPLRASCAASTIDNTNTIAASELDVRIAGSPMKKSTAAIGR